MIDFIEEFIGSTTTTRSPTIFRLWAGISTLAAALDRKIWTETDVRPLRPNLYIVLVGAPASGKTNAVLEGRAVLSAIKDFKLGPDDPTRASFFDEFAKAVRHGPNGSSLVTACCLALLCREFGVLFKPEDEIYPHLTDIYDNPPSYTAPRRASTSIHLENPTLNILAAATPTAIGQLPLRAWGEGCTSRIIFIYGVMPQEYRDMFKRRPPNELNALRKRIQEIYYDVHGEMFWRDDAQEAMKRWFNEEKMAPKPLHPRLENYAGRRDTQAQKLMMISAISAGHTEVEYSDFERGKQWIFDAEKVMPDVFTAMIMKSDITTLKELHYFAWNKFNNKKDKSPLPDLLFARWLEERVTSEKIPHIMKQMEDSGRLKRAFTGGWTPNNLDFEEF